MKQVNIYSDGACSGNPGPGGYARLSDFTFTLVNIKDMLKNLEISLTLD